VTTRSVLTAFRATGGLHQGAGFCGQQHARLTSRGERWPAESQAWPSLAAHEEVWIGDEELLGPGSEGEGVPAGR